MNSLVFSTVRPLTAQQAGTVSGASPRSFFEQPTAAANYSTAGLPGAVSDPLYGQFVADAGTTAYQPRKSYVPPPPPTQAPPPPPPADAVSKLIAVIISGDLASFERHIRQLQVSGQQIATLVNAAAKQINRAECWMPAVATFSIKIQHKIIEHVIVTFRVDRVKRILTVSSDPSVRASVSGPPKDSPNRLPVPLNEDPAVLFRQVARIMSIERIPAPPPMAFR